MFTELSGLLVWCMTFPLHLCYIFWSCPIVLKYSVLFSQSMFCLVLVLRISIEMDLNSRDSFPSCVHSTNKPIKGLLPSVTEFFISSVSYWFFLRIFIFAHIVLICSFLLYTSAIKALSILILFVLNSWFDNSNIPAKFESTSGVSSVSSSCFFSPFSMLYLFFFFLASQLSCDGQKELLLSRAWVT